jgi:hypothetical protein
MQDQAAIIISPGAGLLLARVLIGESEDGGVGGAGSYGEVREWEVELSLLGKWKLDLCKSLVRLVVSLQVPCQVSGGSKMKLGNQIFDDISCTWSKLRD